MIRKKCLTLSLTIYIMKRKLFMLLDVSNKRTFFVIQLKTNSSKVSSEQLHHQYCILYFSAICHIPRRKVDLKIALNTHIFCLFVILEIRDNLLQSLFSIG